MAVRAEWTDYGRPAAERLRAEIARLKGDDALAPVTVIVPRLHERLQWMAPAELADLVVRDRRGMELGFAERRARDVWRRLRWMIDQARAWSDVTGGTLRAYLAWVDQQNADGARVAEAVLPETDDDAVRIMTIHAGKGLEFPVAIVSGLSSVPQSRPAPADVVFRPDGQVGYRFGAKVKTVAWETRAPIDEQMSLDERIRLLYVACTRARDHLVVSLHRKERRAAPEAVKRTNAELLVAGMGALVDDLPDAGVAVTVPPGPPVDAPVAASLPLEEWRAVRTATLAAARQPAAVAATALSEEGVPDGDDRSPGQEADPGLQKPRDLDLPPWLKVRYGTAVGRAVHGVLQVIDLAGGAGLEDAVAAQCQAEAIPTRADAVARLSVPPSPHRSSSPPPACPTGGRCTRPHPWRMGGCSRAISISSTGVPTASSSSTTRRRPPPPPAIWTAGSRATGCRARRIARR